MDLPGHTDVGFGMRLRLALPRKSEKHFPVLALTLIHALFDHVIDRLALSPHRMIALQASMGEVEANVMIAELVALRAHVCSGYVW